MQAWAGILGGIIINGPASSNYDVDLGTMILNDWSHATTDQMLLAAVARGPQTLENGLINGTNTYNNSGAILESHFETVFEAETRYRSAQVRHRQPHH